MANVVLEIIDGFSSECVLMYGIQSPRFCRWHWILNWSKWILVAGGYLVERWIRGCAAQIGCFFGLSGFAMAPFLFENWFWYKSRFFQIHNFRWIFSFGLSIGCQKVLMHPNLHCKKHWLVLKRALQETNGFYIGSKFASSLVLL